MTAGDDPTPWRFLAEGTIVGLARDEDTVHVVVELRTERVTLHLAGCDAVRYQPHDEPMLYDLDAIAASEPDIRDAHVDHGAVVVNGGAGALRLVYANLRVEGDVDLGDLARRQR